MHVFRMKTSILLSAQPKLKILSARVLISSLFKNCSSMGFRVWLETEHLFCVQPYFYAYTYHGPTFTTCFKNEMFERLCAWNAVKLISEVFIFRPITIVSFHVRWSKWYLNDSNLLTNFTSLDICIDSAQLRFSPINSIITHKHDWNAPDFLWFVSERSFELVYIPDTVMSAQIKWVYKNCMIFVAEKLAIDDSSDGI